MTETGNHYILNSTDKLFVKYMNYNPTENILYQNENFFEENIRFGTKEVDFSKPDIDDNIIFYMDENFELCRWINKSTVIFCKDDDDKNNEFYIFTVGCRYVWEYTPSDDEKKLGINARMIKIYKKIKPIYEMAKKESKKKN